MESNNNLKRINEIIKSTINVIEQSRGAIFEIAENARKEMANLTEEYNRIKAETASVLAECEELEKKLSQSRKKLAMINSSFDQCSEEQMLKAYQETNDFLVRLAVAREREKQIIIRRNEIERRLKNAMETVSKADKLVLQVGTVLSYLSGDLKRIDVHMEKCETKRQLAISIIRAQEDERRRIAREIHDGPAQALSNVILIAEICEKLAETDKDKAIDELKSLKEVARDCLQDVRRVIYDLRPMIIDDLGIEPTLRKYTENFSHQYDIQISLIIKGEVENIKDKNVILAIFRVVQECLNNIRKHAKASLVLINLECSNKRVNLRIKDDGVGFDISSLKVPDDNANKGFGIIGMKERIELLGGSFSIESDVGVGTVVRVQLPYDF